MQDRSPPTLQIFLLRTAGPYIWVIIGHGRMSINVRFTPKSGHRSAQWQCPLCARSANQVRSSISLSARATKVAGISTPIAFAAFRLITNSTVPHYGGRRWWFICPIKKIRVAKLFLPPGATQFASRKAHDLTYRSCRQSGWRKRSEKFRRRMAQKLDDNP
jgi:hypothetical protein